MDEIPRRDTALSGQMTAEQSEFDRLRDGRAVDAVLLSNRHGMRARIITLGATLQALEVPDRHGNIADITLGYDSADAYLADPFYIGASVGRYANRIAQGRFTLDDTTYQLARNNGPNHLHGGVAGFNRRLWSIMSVDTGPDWAETVLRYISPDGEEFYPGTLTVDARYRLTDDNSLTIAYTAATTKPTLVNMTSHSYWNLSGLGTAETMLAHRVMLHADHYTPVADSALIPTGAYEPVTETPFDFRAPRPISDGINSSHPQIQLAGGYDHNFVVDGEAGTLRPAARVEDPLSGRVMDLLITAPGLQYYSGHYLDSAYAGRNGVPLAPRSGFCLEPQAFPDSPNQPAFPSTILRPSETYRNEMMMRFGILSGAVRAEKP